MVMDKPQPTPRLSPADHLVQALEQGGDRAALAQWSAVKVKITAASQSRTYRGDVAGVDREPAQAGTGFLASRSVERICLSPTRKPWGYSSATGEDTLGCLCSSGNRRNPPQVSKPALVQPQGKLWRVVKQGEVLIRI